MKSRVFVESVIGLEEKRVFEWNTNHTENDLLNRPPNPTQKCGQSNPRPSVPEGKGRCVSGERAVTRPNHVVDFVSQSLSLVDQKYFSKNFLKFFRWVPEFEIFEKIFFFKLLFWKLSFWNWFLKKKRFDPRISPMSKKIQRLEMERNSISNSSKSRSENYTKRCSAKNGSLLYNNLYFIILSVKQIETAYALVFAEAYISWALLK